MTIILAALSDEQTALVVDLEHPQLMPTALQKMYRHVYNTTVGTLKREYMALYINVCVWGGGVLQHIRHTRLMLADLECYKVSLSDGEKQEKLPSKSGFQTGTATWACWKRVQRLKSC
ncbi:hypothetical protein PF005_g7797 [Phytophthora fragariae]|uniref:Uncharacterized protein n=1 Tax=Phytophthora fragariae TaxID=53985 RepID=A0A6A3FIV6_9STRA|nr:hypothetical protein PF003_g1730 [Phytophthora fragariae]KAE8941738.1 hypothetical protein PF009_g8478 [Phytophthora fragariae]KAE9122779.1 hypothetical protein PF010_g6636 [Phytophthora fragariae]KAE9123015.1 hypothetical protein PF007_g7224 [Phytophthora fragariae]KAE9147716.1 hypothetical protein PF006_g7634 [Phytophthora fragariae]